jgi:polysaccharide biosynthesis/export protein
MQAKKFISLLLVISFLISPTQGWCQKVDLGSSEPVSPPKMEDQARFYLQRITPGPPSSGDLPPSKPQPQPYAPEPAKMLTTAPRQPEEISASERRAAEYGMPVKQFGYSFFYKPPETFLPVQNIPVGPDYVIGPGDTVHIVLWGSVQGEYTLTVDRNGTIAIPKVGVVHVSGLTFKQLREVTDREFSRQYNNFQMNVTLDNLRTIQVFVVGQARFPGSYAVSSLSTLISALFASGGPSKTGSMRNIQVRRGGRVVTHFDMYDFLLRGDKSKDLRLQSEDVIFIPPIGPLAAIGSTKKEAEGAGGPIKVPGFYELKNEKTLTELIQLAGGLADTAFKGRIQVLRIKDSREMVLLEDDLGKVLSFRLPDVPLVDGDMVKIFPVPDLVEKKVRVAGAVKNPGEFGLRANMRIKDLINYAGGLLLEANQEEAEVTRVTINPQGPETTRIYISPRLALSDSSKDNLALKPNDYLFIRTVPEWDLYKLVNIAGEVKFPGTYAIKKGETLSSALARAGGFAEKAYPKGTVFTRVSVKATQEEHLKQAISRVEAEMYALAAQKAQTATDKDEAQRQEVFVKQQQMLLAKLKEVAPLGRVVVRLDDPERLRGTPGDIELQKGDSIYIPQIQQTVNVLGSVANPTAIVYDPYLTVKDYIIRAGGTTRYADAKGAYLMKVNGSAISNRSVKWIGASWVGDNYAFQVGGFENLRLDPGDTIVVPEELERIAWLKEIKDVAVILGNIAMMAGVVLVGLK